MTMYHNNTSPGFADAFEMAVLRAEAGKKQETTPTGKDGCTMVEYSAKAVAVFGDTKSIKDELRSMGGRFNSRLTINGNKIAGWIFSKTQEKRLACYFGLD